MSLSLVILFLILPFLTLRLRHSLVAGLVSAVVIAKEVTLPLSLVILFLILPFLADRLRQQKLTVYQKIVKIMMFIYAKFQMQLLPK